MNGAGLTFVRTFVTLTDDSIDGKRMPLVESLEMHNGDHDTILICIPDALSYYEGEAPSTPFVIARPCR